MIITKSMLCSTVQICIKSSPVHSPGFALTHVECHSCITVDITQHLIESHPIVHCPIMVLLKQGGMKQTPDQKHTAHSTSDEVILSV